MIQSINHELGYCSCKEPWPHPINALEELEIDRAEMRWLAACDVLAEWRKERRMLAFQIVVGGWFWDLADDAAKMRGLPERKRNWLTDQAAKLRAENRQPERIEILMIEEDFKIARAAVAERCAEFPPYWQKYALAVCDYYRLDHPEDCPGPHSGACKTETFIPTTREAIYARA